MKKEGHLKLILLLICFLPVASSEAKEQVFLYPEGVIQQACTNIKDITRDSTGFLWFATPDGLFRYDGNQAKMYRSPDVNVSYQGFKEVFTDGGGNLWARNFASTYLYDFSNDCLTLDGNSLLSSLGMDATAESILVDQEGNLWAEGADGTLWIHSFGTDGTNITIQSDKGPFVSAASRGTSLFVLTSYGEVLRVNPGEEQPLSHFADYPTPRFTNDLAMYIDSARHLWIYDGGDYSPYVCFDIDNEKHMDIRPLTRLLGKDHINSMEEGSDSILWIATEHSGIVRFELDSGTLETLCKDSSVPCSLPSNSIDCLYISGNTLWAGTHYCGPVYTYLANPVEEHIQTTQASAVNMLTEDSNGNLWVSHDQGGLTRYSPDGSAREFKDLPNPTVLTAAADAEGRMWFGSYGGGVFYHERGRFITPEELKDNPGLTLCQAIRFDSKGTLWIASCDRGLYSMDREGNVLSYPGKMSTDFLTALEYNPVNNNLYVGTTVGLYCVDTSSGNIELLDLYKGDVPNELSHPSVICICVDDDGRTWVGAYNGLYALDSRNKVLRHLRAEDGLLISEGIQCITHDGRGRVWAVGYGSLACIETDSRGVPEFSGSFSNFSGDNSLNPIRGAICRTSNGRILIGSEGCIIKVNPEQMPRYTEKSKVVLTELRVNGELVKSLQASSSIRLSYEEASYFTIGLSSLNLDNISPKRFRYRLSGEEPWKYTQDSRIPFRRLEHGRYSLEVEVLETDGKYGTSAVLSLTVLAPWWYSVPAKVCYGLLLAFLAAMGVSMVRKRHRESMERQRREIEAKNRERMKEAEKEILTRIAGSQLLQKVNGSIDRHLSDTEYSIDDLCSDVGISRSGLYKKVIATTGVSPLEYIHLIRVKKGKEIMDGGEGNVSQAAWAVGLSPKQFSKYFREMYGKLPSDYVKDVQE